MALHGVCVLEGGIIVRGVWCLHQGEGSHYDVASV